MSFRSKPVGWRGESYRHYLASKGIASKMRIEMKYLAAKGISSKMRVGGKRYFERVDAQYVAEGEGFPSSINVDGKRFELFTYTNFGGDTERMKRSLEADGVRFEVRKFSVEGDNVGADVFYVDKIPPFKPWSNRVN